ncbi:MAG TPA: hypothetical protein VM344_03950 [Vitreimonas sp.]|nr:hypothetical protein [Vitreimonas sp.]
MADRTRDRPDDRWQDPPRRRGDARRRGRLVTPVRVVLVLALVGSFAYVAYALVVVRDTSAIPMLAWGAVALGVVFLALAVVGGRGTLSAGRAGRSRDAFLFAIGGGIAAIIGFGCLAAATVLGLVLQGA